MKKLESKVAIITGGSGGIGLATAKTFVAEGASVVLVDLDEEKLRRAAESIDGSKIAIVRADVSNPSDTERYVNAAIERFGGVDILFANAGIEGAVRPISGYPIEEFDRVIAVNLRGVWLAVRQVMPAMQRKGSGSIVITSSVAGLVGFAGLSAYVASKHALIGVMRCAAIEGAPYGIRVNTLNPGPIENRMMRSIEGQLGDAQGAKQEFEKLVPLKRYGSNEEIAKLALFLACDDSSYSSGSVFVADGGMTAS